MHPPTCQSSLTPLRQIARHAPPTLFILLTVTIDAMGIGLILPVMPDLITEVRGAGLANAALWGGILSSTYAVMQFLCSPTLGNLSDRFGKRPVLLVSMAVLAADYVLMSLAGTIWLLIIGRIIAGIPAGTHATALAYMADISEPDKRAQNFGLISAGFGMGFVFGPLLAAFLGDIDPRAPFVAAACLAAANFAFDYFILPESLPPERRRPFQWRRANPADGLMQIGALPGVRVLLMVMLAYQMANFVYPSIWAYSGQANFGWTSRMVGISLGVYGVAMAVVQGGLIHLILNTVCLVGYGFITQAWMVWVLIPISAMGAMVAPAMQGVLSRAADDDQQGELQGVLASISSLSMILSPMIMTQAFFWFTREDAAIWLPGAPFLAAAVLMAVAFTIFASQRDGSNGSTKPTGHPRSG